MNVPRLRFKEFSGEWEVKKLNEITSYVDYRGKTPEKSDEGVFLVTAKNIRFGYIDYEASKEYILLENYEEVMRRGKPLIGDVLITTEAPLGNVASIDRDDIALAQRVIKLRGKKGLMQNSFLKFYLLSERFQKNLFEKASGGTVKGIKGSVLHKMKLQFPTILEQTKIANFLTAVDEKIAQLTQKGDLLARYKKGVMQQIFSQQLRFKDDDGLEFPEWETDSLQNLFTIKAGGDISQEYVSSTKNKTFKYPVFANSDKNLGFYGFSNIYRIDVDAITVTGRGNLGVAIPRYEPFYPIVRLLILIPKRKFNIYFGATAINRINFHKESTGVPQLTAPQLSIYEIDFPVIEEQTKIANFLTALDDKITHNQTQLNALKQYKQGLLQQMFV